jgi:hypothetical protein
MKRLAGAVVALVAIVGFVVVAQATTLSVDAGVLQTMRVDAPQIEDEPPPAPEYTIKARLMGRNPGGQFPPEGQHTNEKPLGEGTKYTISYTGTKVGADCPALSDGEEEIALADLDDLEFTVTGEVTHVVCVAGHQLSGDQLVINVAGDGGSE